MSVSVYNEEGRIIATVEYDNNLDFWDGNNYTCGSTGRHKGLTKLENGQYVLINGTDWQGERDSASIISAEDAVQEILRSENMELFDEPKFKELKEIYNDTLLKEKKDTPKDKVKELINRAEKELEETIEFLQNSDNTELLKSDKDIKKEIDTLNDSLSKLKQFLKDKTGM